MILGSSAGTRSFSLVEVVLAIGIVSFSVLATVGLLAVGNETNKRARDEGFAAQIAATSLSGFARLVSPPFRRQSRQLCRRVFSTAI